MGCREEKKRHWGKFTRNISIFTIKYIFENAIFFKLFQKHAPIRNLNTFGS